MAKKHRRLKNETRIVPTLSIGSVAVVMMAIMGTRFLFHAARPPVPNALIDHDETKLPQYALDVLGAKTESGATHGPSVRLPILIYHYVEYVQDKGDTIRQSLNIPPHILTQQIETLKKAGYMFVTPSYSKYALDNKMKPADKIVMLTFDDGYRDFYTDVFPILQKEQVKAVAYIVPNFLDRPNFMYTSQLKEIAKSPWVEIGAHTMDHVWLKGVSEKTARYEIIQSRKTLQDLLGVPVNSFAYPYGAF